MKRRIRADNSGFTMVELIIVIAIIAILAITLAPNLVKWVDKSRWAKDQADAIMLLGEVQTAIIDVTSQDKNATVTDDEGTITLTRDDVPKVVNASSELTGELTRMDSAWNNLKVMNRGGAEGSKATYVITFDNRSASGAWS